MTYVLSPWKQNETGARAYAESILKTLAPNAVFFADYSIWAVVNYLQVVEGARPDVTLVELPSLDTGEQLPLVLRSRSATIYLGDVNRYYAMGEIVKYFRVVPEGPVYRLTPITP